MDLCTEDTIKSQDLQIKLTESIEKNPKNNIESLNEKKNLLIEVQNVIKKRISGLQESMTQLKELSAQKKIKIDSLKAKLMSEIKSKLMFDFKIREKTLELSFLNKNVLKNLNGEDNELKEFINSEKLKIKELIIEIEFLSLILKGIVNFK